MSGPARIIVEIAVGEATDQVTATDAHAVVAAAVAAGVSAIRLRDSLSGQRAIDPSVAAAHLAGRHPGIGWIVDAPTTHNAPYNLARRILSFDRATDGRAGVVLTAGAGDEVSEAAVPDPAAADPSQRWSEYATILTRLWESFPRAALRGDQDGAVVADDSLIRPIDVSGRFYRVAGPLDSPSSVQGRPVLLAADPDAVGWNRIAGVADGVIAESDDIAAAAQELSAAAAAAGRRRDSLVLLARTSHTADWERLHSRGADGILLAVAGGAPAVLAALHALPTPTAPVHRGSLRAQLGLPSPEVVLT
jgi:alkanesulfonate monooxygenase SsuD/methylene tetrahydromethanopterin reductase-like flavin-dependent oxidoreductase (luciferase family)